MDGSENMGFRARPPGVDFWLTNDLGSLHPTWVSISSSVKWGFQQTCLSGL